MREQKKTDSLENVHAVILAGGRGTRFWPLGRESKPKQFFPITGSHSMVEQTVARIRPLVPLGRIWTIADRTQTQTLRKTFPKLPRSNFLVEPEARNTGPALIMATARAWIENPRSVVVVLPADHYIRDNKSFLRKIEAGVMAASRGKALVTFGVPPTYPATGYGYIRISREGALTAMEEHFYPAVSFKEKPSLETADQYLAQGDSFWNSGIFIWEAEAFAGKLEAHAPELYPAWKKIVSALKRKNTRLLASAFRTLPALSIDYALMEKSKGVLVGEGDFGWSDVGSWSSLLELWPRDREGNVLNGESVILESRNCLVYNPGRMTALIGVRDLLVVDTEDALLVCSADRDQRVKDIVEMLRKSKKSKFL